MPGAFAEYVCVPADMVESKPANLTFEQAAAMPLAGNTALMGLRDLARVQPGQQILVNCASGGVGTFAVQLAKSFGAHVTGVCSTKNVDLVRAIGADHVIDYTRDDFTRNGRRYDVVFDLVGNRSLTDCRRALTASGTLILSGGGVSEGGSLVGPMGLVIRGRLLSRFVRHRLLILTATPSKENLATLRELAESGKVTPVIDRTYPLSEAPDAIRYLEVEHARGEGRHLRMTARSGEPDRQRGDSSDEQAGSPVEVGRAAGQVQPGRGEAGPDSGGRHQWRPAAVYRDAD